jgi:hypothetical protein
MTRNTDGTPSQSSTRFSECGSCNPSHGNQSQLWTTQSSGSAKLPSVSLPVSEMTTLRADGDCKQCGGEQAFYIQPIIGMLVEWCGRCRKETVVERRRMPRE